MKKRKIVYILSNSYSGSTLLTFLLALHPKISTVGELKATQMGNVDKYICSCGQKIKECEFWINVKKKASKQGFTFSLDNFGTNFGSNLPLCNKILSTGVKRPFIEKIRQIIIEKIPPCSIQYKQIIKQNIRLIQIICEIQGGEIFLDSSKRSNRLKFFYNIPEFDMLTIYLVRNPYGCAYSLIRRNHTIESAAREWNKTTEECLNVINELPKNSIIFIKYEELCKRPLENLNRIAEFIGIESYKVDLNFKATEHHIIGNVMRLSSLGEIKLDEKWKANLTEEQINIFDKLTKNIAKRLESKIQKDFQ